MQFKEENWLLWELVYIRTPSTTENRQDQKFVFDQSTKSTNFYNKIKESLDETVKLKTKDMSFVTFEPQSTE